MLAQGPGLHPRPVNWVPVLVGRITRRDAAGVIVVPREIAPELLSDEGGCAFEGLRSRAGRFPSGAGGVDVNEVAVRPDSVDGARGPEPISLLLSIKAETSPHLLVLNPVVLRTVRQRLGRAGQLEGPEDDLVRATTAL